MNAVCPACGVAVVPGYVRCPKCHAGLPLGAGRTKRTTADPGGTAVPQSGFPIVPVLVALGVAAAIILVFGVRSAGKQTRAAPPPPPGPIEATPRPQLRPSTGPATVLPPAPAAAETAVQDLRAAVVELEGALRRQRLWGRVDIAGQRIDVRSGSCSDPAMRPLIDGKASLLHAAGLTKLRCVEQSGAVVFERDL